MFLRWAGVINPCTIEFNMVNVALIGYGHFGPLLYKSFNANKNAKVLWICDRREACLQSFRLAVKDGADIRLTNSYKDVLADKQVDLVVVATPVNTHEQIAMDALDAGKHVFIEKPMTMNVVQAKGILDYAKDKSLLVFVDHTVVYSEWSKKIRTLIGSGGAESKFELGHIYYMEFIRQNLGKYREDVNVIWDLACHDLALAFSFISERPVRVSAAGEACFNGKFHDVAYITLNYKSGLVVHISASWLHPVKVRRTTIAGNKKMLVYDEINNSGKIMLYDRGVYSGRETGYGYRDGETEEIDCKGAWPLEIEVEHVIECIKNGKKPLEGAKSGLDVVRVLEGAQLSLEKGGVPISLKS